jgi:hypothetical protein
MMAEWRKQNIRVITLRQVPSLLICLSGTLQTEILTKLQPEDFAEMGKRYSENAEEY